MSNETHNSNSKQSVELRHRLHQEMLTLHRAQRDARRLRSRYASPKRHKEDSEYFGFKTLSVPKI